MRKALIGLLLAATAATPLAAQAADRSPKQQRAMEHYKRLEQRNQARYGNQHKDRSERAAPAVRQQRVERAERRADRAERRADRSERQSNRADQRAERLADRAERQGQHTERREQRTDRRQFQPTWDAATPHYQQLKRQNQRRYSPDRDGRDHDRWDRNRDHDRDGHWDGRRNHHDWNRDWRRDRRYDWQRWRWSNRNLFHIGPYYSPYRGYGYNRFSIGVVLDPGFYANRYWIGDPWQYRLPPAEPGTQWVRYYNDVLLVDVYSGEVLDVIYDFFI